jgi:hypothetical protein
MMQEKLSGLTAAYVTRRSAHSRTRPVDKALWHGCIVKQRWTIIPTGIPPCDCTIPNFEPDITSGRGADAINDAGLIAGRVLPLGSADRSERIELERSIAQGHSGLVLRKQVNLRKVRGQISSARDR